MPKFISRWTPVQAETLSLVVVVVVVVVVVCGWQDAANCDVPTDKYTLLISNFQGPCRNKKIGKQLASQAILQVRILLKSQLTHLHNKKRSCLACCVAVCFVLCSFVLLWVLCLF